MVLPIHQLLTFTDARPRNSGHSISMSTLHAVASASFVLPPKSCLNTCREGETEIIRTKKKENGKEDQDKQAWCTHLWPKCGQRGWPIVLLCIILFFRCKKRTVSTSVAEYLVGGGVLYVLWPESLEGAGFVSELNLLIARTSPRAGNGRKLGTAPQDKQPGGPQYVCAGNACQQQ